MPIKLKICYRCVTVFWKQFLKCFVLIWETLSLWLLSEMDVTVTNEAAHGMKEKNQVQTAVLLLTGSVFSYSNQASFSRAVWHNCLLDLDNIYTVFPCICSHILCFIVKSFLILSLSLDLTFFLCMCYRLRKSGKAKLHYLATWVAELLVKIVLYLSNKIS